LGLILDSSILIAGERRGETVRQVIQRVCAACGDQESALSAISIIDFAHGIFRAKTDADKARRKAFATGRHLGTYRPALPCAESSDTSRAP
jgi:hypothetical protein